MDYPNTFYFSSIFNWTNPLQELQSLVQNKQRHKKYCGLYQGVRDIFVINNLTSSTLTTQYEPMYNLSSLISVSDWGTIIFLYK